MAGTFRDNQPWGTDSCFVTKQQATHYRSFTEVAVWEGYESHWMSGDPPDWHAWSEGDWFRWTDWVQDGIRYLCVGARSYRPRPGGLIDVNCATGEKWELAGGYYDTCAYYNDTQVPYTVGDESGTVYPCINSGEFF